MNVSVIIPAYNAARTIADTINSVLSQVSRLWEAIVVDDGSTDGTAAVASELAAREPRIRVISQANGGESAARNTAIALARHEWLLFLDADDWISPRHIERLTAELNSHPELDAVHCGSVRVALDGTEFADGYLPPSGDMFPTLARRAAFPVHACIVRKSLVNAVGGFDTSLRKSADWDLWQRIARTGALFGAVREVLAYYRMQPHSASLDAEQLLLDGLRVLERGHEPDPRVPNPHPAHANGSPPEEMRSQQFYLLSWCAGLSIGQGTSAIPLLDMVPDAPSINLDPDAIARCLFEAAPLPTGRTPVAWEVLWSIVRAHVEEFLPALEERSGTPELAGRALAALKRMILMSSPSWRSVLEEAEQHAAEERALREALERNLREWQQRSEALGQQNATLAAQLESLHADLGSTRTDLERWQGLARERETSLAKLEDQLWVRLGRRARMLK